MTVLVTGAAGFIGFHVSQRLLARGETVVGLDVNGWWTTWVCWAAHDMEEGSGAMA